MKKRNLSNQSRLNRIVQMNGIDSSTQDELRRMASNCENEKDYAAIQRRCRDLENTGGTYTYGSPNTSRWD